MPHKGQIFQMVAISSAAYVLVLNPNFAAAQTNSPAAGSESTGVGEVVVTAQRREEKLQNTPVAVTALTGATLAAENIRSVEDLSAKVPGFVASTGQGYGIAPLALRGITGAAAGGNSFADDPVGTYFDGVALTGIPGTINNLIDVSKIQVLRGPQGTLFGKNSTAGDILIESVTPSLNRRDGFVQAEVASYGDYRVAAAASDTLIPDVLAARLMASYSDRHGYATNTVDGRGLDGGYQGELRASVLWKPFANFSSTLIVDGTSVQYRAVEVSLADLTNLSNVNPYVARPDLQQAISANKFAYDINPQVTYTTVRGSLINRLDLGWVSLTSTTGYIKGVSHGAEDSDATGQFLTASTARSITEDLSQEFIATGKVGHLSLTAGAYLAADRVEFSPLIAYASLASSGLGQEVIFSAKQITSDYAGFVDATYDITDRLSVSAGIRYGEEDRSFHQQATVETIRSGLAATTVGFMDVPARLLTRPAGYISLAPPPVAGEKAFVNASPRFVVNYKFSPTIFGYGSISQGFKSGGYNPLTIYTSPTVPTFADEKITSYEVGLKNEFFERRFLVNAAAYYYDYSNLQVRVGIPTGGVSIQNAASATVKGVDLETVARLTSDVTLTTTAAYVDAKLARESSTRRLTRTGGLVTRSLTSL